METSINEYLKPHDLGEGHPDRMITLIEAVRSFNTEFDRSYPGRVTAIRYIDWNDMQTKGYVMTRKHQDDSAWSGGFAENH